MNRKSAIRVGDHVTFLFGARTVTGIVTEDRGHIGWKGRNLYRIQFSGGLYVPEPFHVELGADQLTVVSPEDIAAGGDE